MRYYTNLLKFKEKQPDRQQQFNLAKTTYLQTESEESRNESFIDELSKVSGIEQESQINPIKKFETPSSLFSKKKSTHTHQRFKTEPSPEPTSSNSYSNNNYHNYSSQKAEPRRQSRKPREHSFSDSKSMRSGSSK